MEEEEDKKFGEISVRSDNPKVAPVVGDSRLGNNNAVSEGVNSTSLVGDEDQFEAVSLVNQDQAGGGSHGDQVDSNRSSNSDYENCSSGFDEYSPRLATTYGEEYDSSPRPERWHDCPTPSPRLARHLDYAIKQSRLGTSLDSGYSLHGSPLKPKSKAALPNVSPELLHLVDSAIMGKPESLDKLKNIVAGAETFESVDDPETIPFLVVNSLIATMGGVESFEEDEDNNPPSVMLNSRAAIVAAELIPWLPWEGDTDIVMSARTRMARGLLVILRSCTRNRAMCSMAGLLGVLLRSAEDIFSQDIGSIEQMKWNGAPLCYCIQHLAGHSLSVIDLHRWFQVITRLLTTIWAPRLMHALEKAVSGKESKGPACTFEFDGESSGLLGPGESRWPFTNGYAVATWIYIESFADSLNSATDAAAIAAAASSLAGGGTLHMPRLFSFLSADNQGIEAYFHAQFLAVESGSGKGKKASLHFSHAFKPQCWYFVGLEHVCRQGIVGKAESELRLYVDGSLCESHPFEFPRISKPLEFCCIGTNPPPTMAGLPRHRRQCPLFAEMGPVYIFKEPIGPEKMARMACRGGDVLPSFGNGAGLPWLATNDHVQRMAEESSLLDVEIGGCLHLLYHPCLLSGRFCPDASPSGAAGMLRRPAEVLGQVHVATRKRPVEALWALAYGGPISLLPLAVSNVCKDSLEPEQGSLPLSLATASLAAPIFRIISVAIHHPGNNEELCRTKGPEILSKILNYLLQTLSSVGSGKLNGAEDEELVAAVVSLCQSQKHNYALKVQLFNTLLLDLKIWSLCSYGLQKKLLSSLADMVFTESSLMRDANALQLLLDGCRRCYWTIHEKDSVDSFFLTGATRSIGEVNALVDELLVVIELLIGAAPSLAAEDVRCLLGFLVDCPQPNQVARVLHLIYRLVVQPNMTRAQTFAEAFMGSGGIETLLVLLQREAKAGDDHIPETSTKADESLFVQSSEPELAGGGRLPEGSQDEGYPKERDQISQKKGFESQFLDSGSGGLVAVSPSMKMERVSSVYEDLFMKSLGGITLSISADNARNNVYNFDRSDGIVIGIIGLLGALVAFGHLKFSSRVSSEMTSSLFVGALNDAGGSMFEDKVSLLLFAQQKAFQAAPNRLMTSNVYTALLGASINASSTDDGLNLYDSGHRFEHLQLLLVLLHSLPYASRAFQSRALQDLLFLACSHPENRSCLTKMEEWPQWILEVLISNYEMDARKKSDTSSLGDIEDLIHNFLIIILEHSMRQKDGWKEVEATIHCAEWLCIVGGSSTGEQRNRREEYLPIFKRRLLGGLLDFAARELQVQTQVIAAAAAGVAAEGLSPEDAKAEAKKAAQLSVFLVENAIVILMLVEDHLRLRSKLSSASQKAGGNASPLSLASPLNNHSNSAPSFGKESLEALDDSISGNSGGLPLDVLASEADANGQISATAMERLTAAAAAEPYNSVSSAFVSYGSCAMDIAEGWKYRSWLWYGVGLPSETAGIGGGGSGWELWNAALPKDANGKWIELPLVKKSVSMLQALLLDDSGLGGGLGIGGGSGTGMGGMAALYQLLDSDQPFLCMLRMVLLSMREDDNGEDNMLMKNLGLEDGMPKGLYCQGDNITSLDNSAKMAARKPWSALLWSVLSPILNMPISDSKRQRVLVASCVLYSEVWHAVGRDRKPLRRQYLEAIVPPLVSVLRRWRPVLAGIHELATADGLNPLTVDDRAMAADALPIEAALAMISPAWAAAFASPPAAMALAMIAAGASGAETPTPPRTLQLKRDSSMLERKRTKLQTFSSFQKPLEVPNKSPALPKDKAAAKAAALAAARDLERNAKIGSGRGLSAVAMATSSQRRNAGDMERSKRWNDSEAMGVAWTECLQPVDTKSVYGKDFNALSYKYIAVLVASFALARNIQRSEIDRRTQVDLVARHRLFTGIRAWRKLIHCLVEMKCLFGPSEDQFLSQKNIFWKLDFMESSSRMRPCLRRNYSGTDCCGAAAKFEDQSHVKKNQEDITSSCNAPILDAEAISSDLVNEDDVLLQVDTADNGAYENDQGGEVQPRRSGMFEQPLQNLVESTDTKLASEQDLLQSSSVVAPGYVPGELDERIVFELPSSMVRPLKVIQGTFQVTTKKITFIVDNTENNTEMDGAEGKSGVRNNEKDRSWLLASLHQMYSRRYLLRRSALELFMVDRSNFFFDFGSSEGQRNAYQAIVQSRPPHLNNIYLATQRPEQLLKRTQLMERWARWEISNFEYLMQLNTLAGRSYNDIAQYPVFPWILSDYGSKSLDLADPSVYRDLSKPVGALNPDRLKKFQERYANFDDQVIPKFHYSSHYSSAEAVLYYLVRVEPFTTRLIQLRGGKFDHADQMLSDVAATWNGVLEGMSDVKELVPELFYLPEMLTNETLIDFGTTQPGGKLDSVKLPPWAQNPVDFIHKHRRALESEHVSAHLNEWIDLIFGYKQRGKEAISANNVFLYITYEGTVDIDKISDPVRQRAIQDQITYFGQTPSQLLTVPHMKKMPLSEVLQLQTIFRNPRGVKPYAIPGPERCNLPAAAIHASSDTVIIVDTNVPAAHVAEHKWQPNVRDGEGTPFLFEHGKATSSSAGGALIRMFKGPAGSGSDEWQFPQAQAFASSGIRSSSIVSITCDKEIITGGHADNSIKLLSSDGAKTLETAFGHCAPVTCLALSPDSKYLVTGSRDTTLLLWRIHRAFTSHSSSTSEPSAGTGSPASTSSASLANTFADKSRKCRIEGPIHVLRGHHKEIHCCCVSSDLGIVVSCGHSSDVLLHSIRRGRLVRRFAGVEADAVCLSSEGIILIWNQSQHTLGTFTLNGIHIATAQLPSFGGVSCMEISVDGENALIGMNSSLANSGSCNNNQDMCLKKPVVDDSDLESEEINQSNELDIPSPSICILDLHTLKVLHVLKLGKGQDITALALTNDNTNIIVSTADKQLIIFTNPALSLKLADTKEA